MAGIAAPLLIVFAPGSRLVREVDRPSDLPIYRNGPAGTFVDTNPVGTGLVSRYRPGVRISLPTDQIVVADDSNGAAHVGFGGFRFDGMQDGQLVFSRVRELAPEEQLSPQRSFTMTLNPAWVSSIDVDGKAAWP